MTTVVRDYPADLLALYVSNPACPPRLQYLELDLGVIASRDLEARRFDVLDMRLAERSGPLIIQIASSLDQDVNIQVFGSVTNNPLTDSERYDIAGVVLVPKNTQRAISVPLADSWFPWMGVTVKAITFPASGTVAAKVFAQRWTA